jgi:hypothetical protein
LVSSLPVIRKDHKRNRTTLLTPCIGSAKAWTLIQAYASTAAAHFKPKWPTQLEYEFNLNEAKKLLAKKDDANPAEE